MYQAMTTPQQDQARAEGTEAYDATITTCPYASDTQAYRWWQVGWAIGKWNRLWQPKEQGNAK